MKNVEDNKTTEIEVGAGNIFADLGLDDADELYTRSALGIQVMKTIREKRLSQKEAGKLLGLKQPEVSAIMRAKFSRFSQERLIGFLNRFEQKVTIQVSRHHRGEPYQQVTVAP
jgi:predicted XRE-type DNA-binding protein